MEFRIGDRDPVSGLYQVIWPDGSSTLNGIKIFNANHAVGDVVKATHRSDGMIILDGMKATDAVVSDSEVRVRAFGSKPSGYLHGQVFNNDEIPSIRRHLTIRCVSIFDDVEHLTGEGVDDIGYDTYKSEVVFISTEGGVEGFRVGRTSLIYDQSELIVFGDVYPFRLTFYHDKALRVGEGYYSSSGGFLTLENKAYELQIDLETFSSPLQIHCIPYMLIKRLGSNTPSPPDRFELEYELKNFQTFTPYSPPRLVELGAGKITKANGAGFFQENFLEDGLFLRPPTGFVITCDKRIGRVSVA